ncbi:hypothetical protein [Paenibacillus sp. MSJ-34]|uniref:hypothetical protein n=1 Tax=Paenibacillus sp. MSJ-34 TaxID=2841529 RepID=UPI00209E6815|nr:hypothetical protein [Paenibacillus sp. MSJ-34]
MHELKGRRQAFFLIESMKQLLEALETHDLTAIERSFKVALQQLNEQLEKQMNGISEMMRYINYFAK